MKHRAEGKRGGQGASLEGRVMNSWLVDLSTHLLQVNRTFQELGAVEGHPGGVGAAGTELATS